MLLVTSLCLMSLTTLVWSSSQCGDWDSFHVGDGNIQWKASVGEYEGDDIFYPSPNEFLLTGNQMTLELNTATRHNHLKVMQISLEVKGVRKVKLGSDVRKLSAGPGYTRVTFQLSANKNSFKIQLSTRGDNAGVRSVYISGCFDETMVSINKGLDLFKALWEQKIPVDRFIHDFYTEDAIFIEPGQDIRYGPDEIAKYIFGPVQRVRPTVDIDIQLAEKLSEVRLFTFHLAVFYNKNGKEDPPRRYFILWRKDEFSSGWKVNRVTVNYKEEPTQLYEDIQNLPVY